MQSPDGVLRGQRCDPRDPTTLRRELLRLAAGFQRQARALVDEDRQHARTAAASCEQWAAELEGQLLQRAEPAPTQQPTSLAAALDRLRAEPALAALSFDRLAAQLRVTAVVLRRSPDWAPFRRLRDELRGAAVR